MAARLAQAEDERPVSGARPGRWFAAAWQRLGWRQVVLAALIFFLAAAFGPNGGMFLLAPSRAPDPVADLLAGRWLWSILPLVFAAMIADEAYRDGVRPVLAYGLALVLGALAAMLLDTLGANLIGWRHPSRAFIEIRLKQLFLQGGLCMAIYVYWRTTQSALERVHASEAERIRERQQLLATQLMALQARVEPQFLFDALSRIGALHERDPEGADAALADLIALLRAMLPTGTAATSTVAREFALAEAWLRVQRHLGTPLEVEIAASPLAAQSGLGAMIVLPLLQEMQAEPRAAERAWRLSAELLPSPTAQGTSADPPRTPRLVLRLAAVVSLPESAVETHATPGVSHLRERLFDLHGSDATLSVASLAAHAPAFELDLPIIQETAPR